MELEKLKEFIENIEEFKTNPACKDLAVQFDHMIELMEAPKKNPKVLDSAYFEQFEKSFKEFWDTFDRAVLSFGMSPEFIKANLNNPELFTPEQWEHMTALKQEILGENKSQPKKLKRKKDNIVRI